MNNHSSRIFSTLLFSFYLFDNASKHYCIWAIMGGWKVETMSSEQIERNLKGERKILSHQKSLKMSSDKRFQKTEYRLRILDLCIRSFISMDFVHQKWSFFFMFWRFVTYLPFYFPDCPTVPNPIRNSTMPKEKTTFDFKEYKTEKNTTKNQEI